ncbi:hypothetical protein BRAO375_190003 [Bradyrhizobium sp. ORS 375]|nr:hypothetical protein BRAO375_190003 [Bradyrhizobium sp. ORS 375]
MFRWSWIIFGLRMFITENSVISLFNILLTYKYFELLLS